MISRLFSMVSSITFRCSLCNAHSTYHRCHGCTLPKLKGDSEGFLHGACLCARDVSRHVSIAHTARDCRRLSLRDTAGGFYGCAPISLCSIRRIETCGAHVSTSLWAACGAHTLGYARYSLCEYAGVFCGCAPISLRSIRRTEAFSLHVFNVFRH